MGKKKRKLQETAAEVSQKTDQTTEQVPPKSHDFNTEDSVTKKKKKKCNIKDTGVTNSIEETSKQRENPDDDQIVKKDKKSKKSKELSDTNKQSPKDGEYAEVIIKKSKKNLKDSEHLNSATSKSSKRGDKKRQENIQSIDASSKTAPNKKLIFVDDEISEPQTLPSESNVKKKKQKCLNKDEADVRDEDIDKFCDEVDDEDNKVYENWVQLLEAKLHSNIKKKQK